MIEKILIDNKLIAIIISHKFTESGIHFFSPNDLSQQLAYMRHPAGRSIEPHFHNPVKREVHYTQEVLFIKKGKLRVDFFDQKQNYMKSKILEAGDVLFLVTGGHGFEVIEEVEMFEVKQGPYTGEHDKTRFKGVEPGRIVIEGKCDD